MTLEEINNILPKTYCKNLIDSKEFYFQKGQDALIKWLNLQVNDAQKAQLIELGEDYEKLKQVHNSNAELKETIDLLFEITSYCDIHANEKDKYNKYEDNRTIAKAGVRMGNWMAGLIKFKFKHETITGGSILNAFNYLLDPQNNTGILSENHRTAIANNLFKKEYDPKTFVVELKNYYSQYNIHTTNPDNYTQILSVLIYEMSKEWKDEVVGLMASDGTQWQDEHIEEMEGYDASILWNSKRPSGTTNTIKFLKNIISEGESFPLYYSIGGSANYKAEIIDFAESQEDLNKKQWDKKYNILYYHHNFSDYKDSKKAARIVFLAKAISKIDPIPVVDFEFYDGYEAPRQDNLSPIKTVPTVGENNENKLFPPDQFDTKDFEEYIQFIREIINRFELKQGDERLVFSIRDNNLNFIIGQRYCWNLYVSNTKGQFGIISKVKLNETSKKYKGSDPVPYYTHFADINSVNSNIKSIDDALVEELGRSKKSSYLKFNNIVFENYVFNLTPKITNKKNMSLNQILFGPPGTGKTYNSINKAIKIINPNFDLTQERKLVKDEFDRLIRNGQIVFTTFHQSMSYEDFIEGIKPLEPKLEGQPVIYKVVNGILKEFCKQIKNSEKLTNAGNTIATVTNFDELYAAFLNRLTDIISYLEEGEFHIFPSRKSNVKLLKIEGDGISTSGETANTIETITKEKLKRIYDKFQSPDDIKNINEQLRKEVGTDIGWTTNYYAIFKAIKDFEKSIASSAVEQKAITPKNYVLIIDEINRGNVSQIFGELITLIEDDKRLGKPEALEATLVYSKERFGIPPNLYLVGTMNTADRSVEALDTALRRRFVFEEIPPKYDLPELQYTFASVKCFEIIQTINKRIEKLLDKDHLIGHSYFILKDGENANDKLKNSFYKNIIPLLQEYFFGDFGKIGLVLGQGFVNLKNWDDKVDTFAEFDHESTGDFESKDVYEIIDYRETTNYEVNKVKMDFEKAIKRLMKLNIV